MDSPCYTCEYKDEDKNSDRCVNCEKRIEYAEVNLMIPNEAVEAKRFAREETDKIKVKTPKEKALCRKCKKVPAVVKGLCQGCYSKSYYARRQHDTKGAGQLKIDFFTIQGDRLEIFKDLEKIARKELRPVTVQAVYFIKQGIERYKQG